jgi:hypothetical protein
VIEGTAEPVVLPTAEAQFAPTPGPNIREAEPIEDRARNAEERSRKPRCNRMRAPDAFFAQS